MKLSLWLSIVLLLLSGNLYALAPLPPPAGHYSCEIKHLTEESVTPELVASSEYIVEGSLVVPEKQIKQILVSKKHKYVLSSLVHVNAIKGDISDKKITISHFAREQKHNVCVKSLIHYNKKRVIAFLVKSDEFEEGNYFFRNKYSLMIFSQEKTALARSLIKRQKQILREFNSSELTKKIEDKQLYDKVKNLIKLTASKPSQQQAFDQLFKLGKPAVPFIIMLMKDYRKLPNDVTYSPFMNHYGPEVVLDGLSTTLAAITGKFDSRVSNGGSARERQHILDLWRLYLNDFK